MIPDPKLISLAKAAFETAVAMGVRKPEGVAILMKSGVVHIGCTQPKMNAARDALRSAIASYPSEDDNIAKKVLDQFTIASVVLVTKAKNCKPVSANIGTFEEYPSLAKDASLYTVSHETQEGHMPTAMTIRALHN